MKKRMVLMVATTGMLLAACGDGNPDEKLSTEILEEYVVEKELNVISGIKDENFLAKQDSISLNINKQILAEKVLDEQIKIDDGIIMGKEFVMYGYEGIWGNTLKEMLLLLEWENNFSNKKIEKMEKFLEENYFQDKKIPKSELRKTAVEALMVEEKIGAKKADITEYYEQYYLEKIYKGLIDLPTYEENKDVFKALYLVEKTPELPREIDKQELNGMEFAEGYKWLKEAILNSTEKEEVAIERKNDDVIVKYGDKKITLEDLVNQVYRTSYLDVYKELKMIKTMKTMVSDIGYDIEKIREDLRVIGLEFEEVEAIELAGMWAALNASKYFEGKDVETYYQNKVAKMNFTEEMKNNDTIKMFYMVEYYHMNTTDQKEVDNMKKEILKYENIDEKNEFLKEMESVLKVQDEIMKKAIN